MALSLTDMVFLHDARMRAEWFERKRMSASRVPKSTFRPSPEMILEARLRAYEAKLDIEASRTLREQREARVAWYDTHLLAKHQLRKACVSILRSVQFETYVPVVMAICNQE